MKNKIFFFAIMTAGFTSAQTGNVGINTKAPTETLDVNGVTRIQALPKHGDQNAINTNSDGTASATKDQTFIATKTLVADKNGVIGAVDGVPVLAPTANEEVRTTVRKCVRTAVGESGYFESSEIPFIIDMDGQTLSYTFRVVDGAVTGYGVAGQAVLLMKHNNNFNQDAKAERLGHTGASSVKGDFTLTTSYQNLAALSFVFSEGMHGYIILHQNDRNKGGLVFDYRLGTINKNNIKFANLCIEAIQ